MSKRLKSLRRIETVQGRLVALADLQLAQAERRCRALAEDQARLRDFIGTTDALGAPLAKAAVRASLATERRLVAAEAQMSAARARGETARRRERTVATMAETEAQVARRAADDRDLAETLEAWLAREAASLP